MHIHIYIYEYASLQSEEEGQGLSLSRVFSCCHAAMIQFLIKEETGPLTQAERD